MIEVIGYVSLALVLMTLALVVWNVSAWPQAVASAAGGATGDVAVLIPARNEEANILACIESALAGGTSVREVVVYEDRSTDGTAAVVRAAMDGDHRVRLVDGDELPAGWCGKTHACETRRRGRRRMAALPRR